MTLQADIQSLVSKFASDLEALVRSAAVGAVQSALGDGVPAPRAAVALQRTGAKPAAKTKLSVKQKQPKPAAARDSNSKRVRRTPEQLAATADQIAAYVKANPNSRAEQIKQALGIANNQWQGPIGLLLDGKRLIARGEKRATTYNIAGASSAGNVVLLKRK